MKTLILLPILLFVCSCVDREEDVGGWRTSSSGVFRNIETKGAEQSAVIETLEKWLIAEGYETPTESWLEFVATSAKTVEENGERTTSYAYVKELSEGNGSIAFQIALPSREEPCVTIFYVSKYEGKQWESKSDTESEYYEISDGFGEFIDSSFDGASKPRASLSSGRLLDREE